jgi:hypothetical protein
MSWTVWQRRSKCENCGARIPVPPEGLYMTCEYCGTNSPVPDMEARRQAQDTEARATRRAEKARRRQQEGPRAQPAREPGSGSWNGVVVIIGVLLLLGGAWWKSGLVEMYLKSAGFQALVGAVDAGRRIPPPDVGLAPDSSRPKARQRRRPRRRKQTKRKSVPRRQAPSVPKRQAPSAPKRQAPRPVGPTPSLNPPPQVAPPEQVPLPYEAPETDLDRALEDDEL